MCHISSLHYFYRWCRHLAGGQPYPIPTFQSIHDDIDTIKLLVILWLSSDIILLQTLYFGFCFFGRLDIALQEGGENKHLEVSSYR